MKKNLLLTIFLVFLMVMNGVLLYLFIVKPEGNNRPPRKFIAEQLNLDDNQLLKFRVIDKGHHQKMREMEMESRELKGLLFSNLDNPAFTEKKLDSITILISDLAQNKEKEVFSYFKELEKLCNAKQKMKLQQIVSGALRPGLSAGPRPNQGGPPPPR